MPDLTSLLSTFLQGLYAGVVGSGGATTTLGSATSIVSVAEGTGTATALVGGTLSTAITSTATTGTSEETLLSYTLPANTLAVNGRGVRITAWGTTAANANSKTFRIYFGAAAVALQGGTGSGLPWLGSATVLRASATTQVSSGQAVYNGALSRIDAGGPTETLSGTVLIKVTGQTPTAAGDLTNTGLLVEAI
jgi:hypothetical protein